ncbi:DUF2796 domain-containing protein [Endozoicomonas sp. SCSIO W0465]|uniref:DUF2796 domain-containing protein n=1 Tax=Endozoicomonas sp. SCSIO W0465 TaxID=2918516 RepID=UPI0020752DFE|nr:DUF2796 domain-containing protein [Endozoicomonas sp. SCSIO W0465]USE37851.1 DUF2796 domain-containing protein [Endozoicomonas sp. SCSIO W0465]
MNPGHKVIVGITFCLILVTTIAITASHAKDHAIGNHVHRAYEPAAIFLDVNLRKDTLSLFLSISPEAATVITQRPLGSLARYLKAFTPLVTLPEDAQCRQSQQQFFVEPTDVLLLKSDSLSAPANPREISGYLEYECQHPENLSHFTFLGFEAMPDLKHTSVWLISDNWQSKQRLNQDHQKVQLKKQQDMTDFFVDFFTE